MISGDTTFLREVLVPVVLLMGVAWLLPKLLHRLIGEGVARLFVIGALGAVLLWMGSGAFIWVSDLALEDLARALSGADLGAVLGYIAVQGARAAIIWAPVFVLSVAALPKRWKEAVW
ncbi:MAG: hypothetical protein AAGD04_11555 [Pseudomonadota bacterium]